jgi:DNA-binding NarL/FixJ family response regulator
MDDIKTIVFEDNDDLRESLSLLIEGSQGYVVCGVYPNCSLVREAIEQHAPDVVLMDIDMPEVNGIQGLKIIKEIRPETKVVMLTVFDQNDHVFDAICAGADGYLLKRSSPAEIIDAISAVVSGGAPMTPVIARKVLSFFTKKEKAQNKDELLTPRETEVLRLLVDGFSYKMVAAELNVSIDTVRSHIKSIYRKLHVNSMSEAVVKAIRKDLI